MAPLPTTVTLSSPEATAAFAQRIATTLKPGDCLLLDGPIGAGKTHFARNLIQSLQAEPEDVPSPTFTLVQVYETAAGEIWHADLYRLGSTDELEDLGLSEAFETAICLIEWPDRLGPAAPATALTLLFEPDAGNENMRRITLTSPDPRWLRVAEKVAA